MIKSTWKKNAFSTYFFFDAFFFSKTWFWTKKMAVFKMFYGMFIMIGTIGTFSHLETLFSFEKPWISLIFKIFGENAFFGLRIGHSKWMISDFQTDNFLFLRGDLTAISKKQWSWPWKIVNYQRIIFRKKKCVEIKNAFERIFFFR